MLENYFPVLVFILVGLAFGCVPILLGWLIAPNRPDSEKLSAFECGFVPFEDARMKFDVRYYLIAIIFILFDLEIAFLFPVGGDLQGHRRYRRGPDVRLRRNVRVHRHPGQSATYMRGPRAPWTGNDKGYPRMSIEGVLQEGFVTTSLDKSSTGRAPVRCGR
jgi:NADH:ubiquinone oxidoreductase subunit 3 (subunit A)